MDYTVYKKSEEVEDEYVGKGAKKKKQKGSKEPSPGKPTDVFIQKFFCELILRLSCINFQTPLFTIK